MSYCEILNHLEYSNNKLVKTENAQITHSGDFEFDSEEISQYLSNKITHQVNKDVFVNFGLASNNFEINKQDMAIFHYLKSELSESS